MMLELGHLSVAHQTPLSMGFPRQEYWSGLPYPPPGDLLDPGIEPASPASLPLAGRFFLQPPGSLLSIHILPLLWNALELGRFSAFPAVRIYQQGAQRELVLQED